MFNSVLLGIRENEKVQVLEKTSEIKPNGSEAIVWKPIKEILCNIQANNKYGDSLSASEASDKTAAEASKQRKFLLIRFYIDSIKNALTKINYIFR